MNLSQLITTRRTATGWSLREMERRASQAGTPISRSTINEYERGRQISMPDPVTREGLASALGVTLDEVTAAAVETAAPELTSAAEGATSSGRSLQHAEAWFRLIDGRTEQEIVHVLAVVKAVLDGHDAIRKKDSNGG